MNPEVLRHVSRPYAILHVKRSIEFTWCIHRNDRDEEHQDILLWTFQQRALALREEKVLNNEPSSVTKWRRIHVWEENDGYNDVQNQNLGRHARPILRVGKFRWKVDNLAVFHEGTDTFVRCHNCRRLRMQQPMLPISLCESWEWHGANKTY